MVSSFLIKQIISSESLCVKNLAWRKIHHKANNQTVETREEREWSLVSHWSVIIVVVAGDGDRGPGGRGDLSLRHHHE